jgi:hypothetical protein
MAMPHRILFATLCLTLSLFATHANACADHFYLNPDEAGFFAGALIKMAGLAPPEQAFKVKHPPLSAVVIGEHSEITIKYKRPWFSKNVRVHFAGTKNVELLDEEIALTDYQGAVTARFRLKGKGFDAITVTVSGEHKGEILRYSSRVNVMARHAPTSQEQQVTAR